PLPVSPPAYSRARRSERCARTRPARGANPGARIAILLRTASSAIGRSAMPEACPECGAPVPDGGTCRDHFHALFLLEGEIPGVAGSALHFYAVAAYGLQHPDGMNYTAEALAGLRAALADS